MQYIGKVHNFKFRLTLTIALALGGIVFPYLFALAALVGWALIHEIRNPQEEVDEWFTRRYMTTADDPRWVSDFLQFCESPAETAFLEAMIDAFNLTPNKGVLYGSGLTVDLQVEIRPYRADFLVNNWLVVEIDGAAYHSSAQAVARDKARDEFMREQGYSVLRIPAKVVFDAPDEAVHRVRSCIEQGRQKAGSENTESQKKTPIQFMLQSLFGVVSNANADVVKSLSETRERLPGSIPINDETPVIGLLARIENAISTLQNEVTTSLLVQKANQDYELAFHAERLAIEESIDYAESEIKANEFISQSKEHRELYLSAYKRYEKLLRNLDNNDADLSPTKTVIVIPHVPEIIPHPNPLINAAVNEARRNLITQREKFFSDTRVRLNGNEKLRKLVRQKLADLGCEECWDYIA